MSVIQKALKEPLHITCRCMAKKDRLTNQLGCVVMNMGALDEGSPMSPVDFKKGQCPTSLFLKSTGTFLK